MYQWYGAGEAVTSGVVLVKLSHQVWESVLKQL
jgi:hypothetical protein